MLHKQKPCKFNWLYNPSIHFRFASNSQVQVFSNFFIHITDDGGIDGDF